MRGLAVLFPVCLITSAAPAQEPIIAETTPPVAPRPKPKPTFTRPRLLWRTRIGRMEATPVLRGDDLYISANNSLIALDTEGHIQWTADVGGPPSAPDVSDTGVFVGTMRGVLQGLSRKTGGLLWKMVTEGNAPLLTPPLVFGDRLFCECSDNNVYALSLQNGQIKWKFNRPDGSLGYSGPLVDGGSLFIAGETTLYSLDPATGKQNWKSFIGGKAQSVPASDGVRIFVGGDGTGLTALNRKDGSPAWVYRGKSEGDWFGSPLAVGGTVYASTYRRFLYALDAETGRFKWSARLPGSSLNQPAFDRKRGVVYVTSTAASEVPTLVAFDSRTGRRLWDYSLGSISGSPIVADDRLYVAAADGSLYAFTLR